MILPPIKAISLGWILLVLMMLNGGPLSAQDAHSSMGDFEEEEILIEADRPEVPGLGEPGQSTLILREELEASGARTVAEVLQRVPGVTVSRQGGGLEAATLSIRGSSADQVLILVDGEPQNGLWGGAVNLNTLSLENVESVEIIRGGGSALYGEGALGGVLNITTREGESWSPEFSVKAGAGSLMTVTGAFTLSGPIGSSGQLSGRLFGEGIRTDGRYDYNSGVGEASRGNNQGLSGSLSGGLGWESVDGLITLDFSGEGKATNRGVPGLMEFLTPEAESREESLGGKLDLDWETYSFGIFRFSLGAGRRLSSYANPDENLDESHDNLGGTARLAWESFDIYTIFPLSLKAGLEGGADRLDSTGLTDSTGTALNGVARQLSASAWGSVKLGSDALSLIPAFRWDLFSQEYIGRDRIDRTALSWSLTGQIVLNCLSLELSGQSSFHNPSFQDLFWPSGAFASGNPDLLPERGLGGDLGISWSGSEGSVLTAGGFYQSVDNLIQWLPAAGGIWRPRNVGEVLVYGVEASYKGIISLGGDKDEIPWFVEYRAGYDWLRCLDNSQESVNFGKQLAYRPEHSGSATLLLSAPGGSSLEVTGNLQGGRFTNNANTKAFDPLFLLDASLRFLLSPHWELSLSGRNLTNKEYIDRLGYPVPGIEWTVEGGYHY